MTATPLTPLRFHPILRPMLWGGHKLRPLLGTTPSDEPTGEAWILSDQGENISIVADGPFAGLSLRSLLEDRPSELLGEAKLSNGRFPLLLKLIDAQQHLSVQVHPNDHQARRLEPHTSDLGKTEAWVILETEPDSLIFAGLRPGVTRDYFLQAMNSGTVPDTLHGFHSKPGDCVFLAAGTVHAIGAGNLLFEVQQTSDITYRLYDWGRIDKKTGQPRALHKLQGMECSDFDLGPCDPVQPRIVSETMPRRERLVECDYFTLDRWQGESPYSFRSENRCRIIVGIEGTGVIRCEGGSYPLGNADLLLLPASIDRYEWIPSGEATVLEIGLGG